MDSGLFQEITNVMPRFNPLIAEGVAVSQMKLLDRYVDHVWRCAAKSFPPGLEYVKMTRCTPEEEFREIADVSRNGVKPKRNGRSKLEIAPSDFYLTMIHLRFEGQDLPPRPLYLPFVGQAGTIRIRGPLYCISPVLADPAFSLAKADGIFIPFTRDKLTIQRQYYQYLANLQIESTYVVWSAIHNHANNQSKKTGVTSCLSHYLFAKYGLHETFKRFVGTDVVVGMGEVCEENYPMEEWVICESVGLLPRGYQKRVYIPSKIRIAVRREHYTALAVSIIAGFFYVVDHFPDRMRPEYCSDPRFWRTLLGHVIFTDEENEGKLMIGIDAHMQSIDEYVDDLVRETLASVDVMVNDIYEFFIYVMENISSIIIGADPSSSYGKRLMVLRYVCFDIVKAIFSFTYELRNAGKKGLSIQSIRQSLGKHLNRDLVLSSLSTKHGEVQNISSPGDSTILKFTSNLVLQTDATGQPQARRGKGNAKDPSKLLHVSVAEVGSYANLPKSDPTGQNKANPYVLTDLIGTIIRDEKKRPLLDDVQRKIQR